MSNAFKNSTVFYDSVCGFCSSSVKLLMRLDRHDRLHFEPLDEAVFAQLPIDRTIESIVFWEDDCIYYKSTAVLLILKRLGGFWQISRLFFVIPRFIRDFIYDVIAKYRYKLMGQTTQCGLRYDE